MWLNITHETALFAGPANRSECQSTVVTVYNSGQNLDEGRFSVSSSGFKGTSTENLAHKRK